MAFFNSAVGVLQTLVIALGAGLGIWGAINLLEGYGNDNPGAKTPGFFPGVCESCVIVSRYPNSFDRKPPKPPGFSQASSIRRRWCRKGCFT